MKRILFISFLLGIFAFSQVEAQTTPKELSKKELKEIQKAARKDAKDYIKDGWKTLPGQLSIEEQQIKSKIMAKQEENNMPAFYIEPSTATGGTYNAAKLSAVTRAKENLAGSISSDVAALIESDLATELENADPSTVDKVKSTGKQLINQKLGAVITVTEMHRKINNQYEVSVTIAYSRKSATEMGKKVITKELKKELKEQREELDKIVGW